MNLQVTLDNSGDHPVYNFTLLSQDNKYRIESKHRFNSCREFHQNIVEPRDVKISASFPETKKRSSLGIKLNEDMLSDRCEKLDKYMNEVLRRYSECPDVVQKSFIKLLAAESIPELYFSSDIRGRSISTSNSVADSVSSAKNLKLSKSNSTETRGGSLRLHLNAHISLHSMEDHPLYKIRLYSSDNIYNVEQTLRFGSYREFYQGMIENCGVVILTQFPETRTVSSMGIKLSEEELQKRAKKLHEYFNDVLLKYKELPREVQSGLVQFLKAEHIPEGYFRNDIVDLKGDAPKEKTSMQGKLIQQMSNFSRHGSLEISENKTEKKAKPLSFQVSRNYQNGRHVEYDVVVRLWTTRDVRITVCSRPFKEFRQLEQALQSNVETIEETELAFIPAFPDTYTRSGFGIALGEAELIQRVRGLDAWVRAITKYYHILSSRSQVLINHFLNLDCLVENEKYEKIIQEQLRDGNVGESDESLHGTSSHAANDGQQGKYEVVRDVSTVQEDKNGATDEKEEHGATNKKETDGGWTVIGGNTQPPPPKGCCVVS